MAAYPDVLPTRVDGSLGRTKNDAVAVVDLNTEWPAAEAEVALTSLAAVCEILGLPDGSTAGSINEKLLGAPANLAEAISSGALANPTTLTVNGAIDTDSQIVFIFSGVYAGLPIQTEAGAIFLYAVGPCALVPYLYPAGSQTINGVLDTPHSLAAAGLYILTRDGAGAWGATSCGDVFNDLTGTNAAPDANVDSTLGYAAKSIRIDTAGAIWMCTSASAAAAVWECISHGQSLGTVSTASGTLGVHSITQVTHAAALCALTLPVSQATWPIGVTKRVRKSNTSSFGISLAPNSGGTVQGGATDAALTLPGSDIPSSTTTGDMWWDVTRDAASTWRVQASPTAAQLGAATTAALAALAAIVEEDALAERSTSVRTVLGNTSLNTYDRFLNVTASADINLTAAPGDKGRWFWIYKDAATSLTIRLVPDGTDKIDDVNATYTLKGCTSLRRGWWLVFNIDGSGDDWKVLGGLDLATEVDANTAAHAAITSTSVTSPRFLGSANNEPAGNSGWYWDATTGASLSVDAVARIMARVSGTTEVSSGQAGTVAVLRLTTASVDKQYFLTNGVSPETNITGNIGDECTDVLNGRYYIKRTGTGNTGWVQTDRCESGTYTPTFTAVSNLDSVVAAGLVHYVDVGDEIIVTGMATIDPTASGATSFGVSLNTGFTSNFAAVSDARGICTGGTGFAGSVSADVANDRLTVTCGNTVTSAYEVAFHAVYRRL
jgi:hypothetical protein